jgi:hypothetical protein
MPSIENETENNFSTFRECLSDILISELSVQPPKPKKRSRRKAKSIAKSRDAGNTDIAVSAPEIEDTEALEDFVEVGRIRTYRTSSTYLQYRK